MAGILVAGWDRRKGGQVLLLSTRSVHARYTLGTRSVHARYTLGTRSLHTQYTLGTYSVHARYILGTRSVHALGFCQTQSPLTCVCVCGSGVLRSHWWHAGAAAGVGGRQRQQLHLRLHGLQLQTRTEQGAVSGAHCRRYVLLLHGMLGTPVPTAPSDRALSVSPSARQRSLWPWRETAPAAASSDWPASQRRAWSDGSSWDTSCRGSPHTDKRLHVVVSIKFH